LVGEDLEEKPKVRSKVGTLLALLTAAALFIALYAIIFLGSRPESKTGNPISIEGNQSLIAFAASGSGTQRDPFILEGLKINASSGDGIFIANTTLFLTIRNVEVYGGYQPCWSYHYGVHLENVHNCSILSSAFDSDFSGVFLHNCTDVTISSATSTSCGLSISNCARIQIKESSVTDSAITNSANVTFEDNHFQKGIVFHGTERKHFDTHHISSDNTANSRPIRYFCSVNSLKIAAKDAGQIIVAGGENVSIDAISAQDVIAGVQVACVRNLSISNSSIQGCMFGVRMSLANDSSIVSSTFKECEIKTILVENSWNITLQGNSIYRGTGVWIAGCHNLSFLSNRLSSSHYESLLVSQSNGILVRNNTFLQFDPDVGSPFEHINFWYVNASSIIDNDIGNTGQSSGHYWAVSLGNCQDILVSLNNISDEADCGPLYSIGISHYNSSNIQLVDNVITGFTYPVSPL
jgi:parallel beta-helix repeat protein